MPVSVQEFEAAAAGALDPVVWDWVAGGAGAERALDRNRRAFDNVALLPRVMRGNDDVDTAIEMVGTLARMPVAVAPLAYQRLYHHEAEIATAAAARAARIPIVLSTLSSCSIEEVASVGASTWFQLYWLRDHGLVRDLVHRAEEAGCDALVVTVDVPVMGARLRDRRNGFTLPPWVTAANLRGLKPSIAHRSHDELSAVAEHTRVVMDPAVSWDQLRTLVESTRMPVVVKGILDPRDAVRAIEIGAQAVVVSNHGGRQLDAAATSVAALPGIVAALGGRGCVLVDSGVRSGLDVLRALALGANGVLLGRPIIWGLALAGASGVAEVLRLVHEDLVDSMRIAGCADTAEAGELIVL